MKYNNKILWIRNNLLHIYSLSSFITILSWEYYKVVNNGLTVGVILLYLTQSFCVESANTIREALYRWDKCSLINSGRWLKTGKKTGLRFCFEPITASSVHSIIVDFISKRPGIHIQFINKWNKIFCEHVCEVGLSYR